MVKNRQLHGNLAQDARFGGVNTTTVRSRSEAKYAGKILIGGKIWEKLFRNKNDMTGRADDRGPQAFIL